MEKGDLHIRYFNNSPSPSEFATVEAANVPALLKGCVKTWPAFHLWSPCSGGLTRLKQLAGTATVQVMASTSGSNNFYGDIRNHERIPIQFESFLNLIEEPAADVKEPATDVKKSATDVVEKLCVAEPGNCVDASGTCVGAAGEFLGASVKVGISDKESEFAFLKSQDVQVYLAQAGIFGATPSPLHGLLEDVAIPGFLQTPVTAINLWMSVAGSRSSTHYDPFHNLLCVVSGSKQVKLWPPSCTPSLYPLAIHGEASNHSGVDFADPDLSRFPKFGSALARCQSATLCPGDALFLPEGWFHQVDSEGVTVAVNLWWPSELAMKLGTHMDAYLLRRLVANLVDSEKEMIVAEFRRSVSGGVPDVENPVADVKEPATDVKEEPATDVKKPVADVKEPATAVKKPVADVKEPATAVKKPVADVKEPATAVKKSATDVVEELCVAEPGKYVGAAGESLGASANVQSAKGSRKKKSKRDRRRSKEHAMKVAAQGSSDELRAAASPATDAGGPKYSATSLSNAEVQALRTLIVCVSDMMMSTSENALEDTTSQKLEETPSQESRHETVAGVLACLEAPSLQRVLLVMSVEFPRTLEALVLHKLSPLGCEVLTRRFEEMDAHAARLETGQEEFYAQIYGVFDDPGMAMAALVDGKEALAALALQRVLDGNLGISCVLPKPKPLHPKP